MESKRELRRRMGLLRATWPAEQQARWSRAIGEHLLALPVVAAARTVFTYISVAGEPDTHELIGQFLASGRTVAVPWMVEGGRAMEAGRIGGLDECVATAASHGIAQPRDFKPLAGPPDIALVPGVAFTAGGLRLGRGGGHYDRYLAAHPGVVALGLAFEGQMVAELPVEAHDRGVQWVVTPQRAVFTGSGLAAQE